MKRLKKHFILGMIIVYLCVFLAPIEVNAAVSNTDIVSFAAQYKGYPYVYNTHGPNSFDCSGFVYYVFNHFGIPLYTSSSSYWNNPTSIGTVVSESQALPGDIVSWNGHVGIYTGDGYCINALNSSTGVVYTKITSFVSANGVSNPSHKYIRVNGVTYGAVNHDPDGYLDSATGGTGTIHVVGWAYDSDTPGQSLSVHVYVGGPAGSGAPSYAITANRYRSDIGGNYGYDSVIEVGVTGTKTIYVYAINSQSGNNPCIGSATVTINPKVTPTALSIKENLTVDVGKTSTLTPVFTPSNVSADFKGIAWTSSNTSVVRISSSGVVEGVGEGSAVITATSKYNTGIKATCTVTVPKPVPVPTITGAEVNDYDVRVTWNESPLINSEDVRVYEVKLYGKGNSVVFTRKNITDTFLEFNLSGPDQYKVVVTAVNTTTGSTSISASKEFTVDMVLTGEWQTANELPSNVTPENCDIEYKHTYEKRSATSPGDGWTKVAGTEVTTYENSGSVRETYIPQTESNTLVLVDTYYYHYCNPSNGRVNYEYISGYTEYHGPNPIEAFDVVSEISDEDNSAVRVYKLTWKAGYPYTGEATCAGGTSAWWYRKYCYQPRVAVTTYQWRKVTDWQTTKDSAASSVQYRFKLKDEQNPVIGEVKVTKITPNGYTISCKASDDTGIKKMVVTSWTDVETESNAVVTESVPSSSGTEMTVTIPVSEHNSLRDVYYHSKITVYDKVGNTTEYISDNLKVYISTLIRSSRKLRLPAELTEIGDEAFAGSSTFGEIIIADGTKKIGSGAFTGCSHLVLIAIPDSVTEIGTDVFAGSSNVVILCSAESTAATYAKDNGIPYITAVE